MGYESFRGIQRYYHLRELVMRELIITRLTAFIDSSGGMGIPRYFECNDDDYITDPDDLDSLSDEELLEVYDACVIFTG